jgi:hypothetical protein
MTAIGVILLLLAFILSKVELPEWIPTSLGVVGFVLTSLGVVIWTWRFMP